MFAAHKQKGKRHEKDTQKSKTTAQSSARGRSWIDDPDTLQWTVANAGQGSTSSVVLAYNVLWKLRQDKEQRRDKKRATEREKR